jgi:hypothetical protein
MPPGREFLSMDFESIIGKSVIAIVPMVHATNLQEFIVRGVEGGGIWVEWKEITDGLLEGLGVPAIKTPIIFLPFHAIKYLVYSSDGLSLSERAFGV